jgi:hypothetical protein
MPNETRVLFLKSIRLQKNAIETYAPMVLLNFLVCKVGELLVRIYGHEGRSNVGVHDVGLNSFFPMSLSLVVYQGDM